MLAGQTAGNCISELRCPKGCRKNKFGLKSYFRETFVVFHLSECSTCLRYIVIMFIFSFDWSEFVLGGRYTVYFV